MLFTKELTDMIVDEVKLLKDVNDCVGVKITNNKGLFFVVVDYGEGMEYLVELNDVDTNNVYEPCGNYNAFSPYGDMDMLIKNIEEYVVNHNI